MIPVKVLVSEEAFASTFVRFAAKVVNSLWVSAWVHGRSDPVRFFLLVGRTLIPWLPDLEKLPAGKRVA